MLEQLQHLGGWILQVVVHRHDVLTLRMVKTRHDGVVLTKIAREFHERDRTRTALHELLRQLRGVVGTAVVHEHEFATTVDRQCAELLDQPFDAVR